MKKLFLAVFALSTMSLAQAEVSYFQEVRSLFSKGSVPDMEKLIDKNWIGRCFDSESPDRPVAAAVIFKAKGNDAGPISSSRKKYSASAMVFPEAAPNYYDSRPDVIKKTATADNFTSVTLKRDLVEVTHSTTLRHQYRISGSYLVEESSVRTSLNYYGVIASCYYFIPGYSE